MRTIFLTAMAVVAITAANAKSEKYMVREDAHWVYEIDNIFDGQGPDIDVRKIRMDFEFRGDTVIGGTEYLKLYRTLSADILGLSNRTDGDTVVVIPGGTELVACLRETGNGNVYAIYEESYRRQVCDFTTHNYRYNRSMDDPLLYGNIEYNIYQLIPNQSPSMWYLMNTRLNEYFEQGFFKFARQEDVPNENLDPVGYLKVWRDDNGMLDTWGHFFFHPWFGYYMDSSSAVSCSSFISPLGALRDNRAFTKCWFSHYIRGGMTVYRGAFYNPDFEATVGIGQVAQDDDDGRWYNVNGVVYDERPAQPGLYIHRGKKVIIK